MTMEYNFDPIFEYKMSSQEAEAFKVGLIWLRLSKEIFLNYKHTKGFPSKGDPRKTTLFRYCFKFIKEVKPLLDKDETNLYITAQLKILKALSNKDHLLVGPHILVGDKAWVRWKIFKNKFDKIQKKETMEDVGLDIIPFDNVKKELYKTKDFLFNHFGGKPTEEQIRMASKDIRRWLILGKISGIYAVLCPYVQKHCKLEDIDLTIYEKSVTPEIKELFFSLFM